MFFEEFDEEGGGGVGEVVSAGVDEGDDGCAGCGLVEGAVGGPFGAGFVAAVELAEGEHGFVLPFVFDEGVFFAGEVQDGLRF